MKNRKRSLQVMMLAGAFSMFALSCKQQQANGADEASRGEVQTEESMAKTESDSETNADQDFFSRVALTDLKEIEVGKLAQQKRPNTPVSSFGKMLENDHTQSSTELKPLANKAGVVLPTEPDAKAKQDKEKLQSLEGQEFDMQFATMMVEGHNNAIALMKEIANNATDENFRSWASGKIPVLQSHLKHAQDLQNQVQKK